METLYFSSGCKSEYNLDSTVCSLKVIRQKINTAFNGNLKSKYSTKYEPIYYEVCLSKKTRYIVLDQKIIYLK